MHQGPAERRMAIALGFLALLALSVTGALWPRTSSATSADEPASITAPDTSGAVGVHTSLALDTAGNPVVSYYDATNGNLKLLHCNDANCVGSDESITAPDPGSDVALYTSLVLDFSGNPVVSYLDGTNGDLVILRCNDPDCAGGDDSITAPDTGGDVGLYTSLALDASGNPVVSYYDATNGDLKLLHCNDPNCAGGDDSITAPDTGGDVGLYTSLALDASGNPVVSYFDATNGDLKLLHCNDPGCSADDDSITAPDTTGSVGEYTSLALDAGGNPVVSYYDATNDDLKLLHCNDLDCVGGGESITTPDAAGYTGLDTSLVLDASGNPVVSYLDFTAEGVNLLHCNDLNCADGDESIISPDTSGVAFFVSLALDASGNPVVSYYDVTNGDLKLLHCSDNNCSKLPPPTPTSTPTPVTTPGNPEMRLTVNDGGQCDGNTCTIELGAAFTLSVEIIERPQGGYTGAQSLIDFGADLVYNITETPEDEIVWPDCSPAIAVRGQFNPETVGHGCLTSLLPPLPVSTYTDTFVDLSFNCSTAPSSTLVRLLPFNDPFASTYGTGFLFPDRTLVVANVSDLTINCGDPSAIALPTATPTSTAAPCPDGRVPAVGGCSTPRPTPTPCPTTKVPVGGGCAPPVLTTTPGTQLLTTTPGAPGILLTIADGGSCNVNDLTISCGEVEAVVALPAAGGTSGASSGLRGVTWLAAAGGVALCLVVIGWAVRRRARS